MNIAAIGAHPDDIEIGVFGTLARHAAEGDKIYILHMVNTGYGDPLGGTTYRTDEEVFGCAKKSAEMINADLTMLNFRDRNVPFNEDSVVQVDGFLRKHKIDTIYTHWRGDSHQDHINTYKTVMAAGRYIDNVYLFEEIPLPRVSSVEVGARHYVNITKYIDIKLKAVSAYKSEIKKYGLNLLEGIRALAVYRGNQCGCKYAEAFEIVKEVRR